MRLKHKDRDIGTDRDDHQGEEQIIPTRQLGDQENPGQRSVHHPRHDTRHTQQSEILLRDIHREREIIRRMRKDKTGDTAQIQTRSENTTAPPSGIRGAGSEYLRKQDQGQEDQDPEIGIVQIVKQTLVHDMRELPVQQRADRIIALTI